MAEGATEAYFLEKWLEGLGRNPDDIAVICFNGLQVREVLKRLAEDENFPAVAGFGFFLDAEDQPAVQRAALVSAALASVSVVPTGHDIQPGVLSNIGGKQVVVFVSPNNLRPGFIEHTVMNEITASQLSPCIEAFRLCVEAQLHAEVSPKALVQAYVGVRKPGLCGTGRGFQSSILEVMHEAYADVRNTLGAIL